jgi:hypothetical protein
MRASGDFPVAGRRVRVVGTSWFDHQWSGYVNDPRAFNWDWFSCRFDDRSELMLYQFLDRKTGLPLASFRNGTLVDRSGHAVGLTAFTAAHGTQVLRAAGHAWPLDWKLRVPRLGLREHVRASSRTSLSARALCPRFGKAQPEPPAPTPAPASSRSPTARPRAVTQETGRSETFHCRARPRLRPLIHPPSRF